MSSINKKSSLSAHLLIYLMYRFICTDYHFGISYDFFSANIMIKIFDFPPDNGTGSN